MSNIKHGLCGTKVYRCWQKMKERCLDVNHPTFKKYGAKGISIHPPWIESVEAFVMDMGLPPTEKHEVDRKNNKLGYTPENCKWATRAEQLRNTCRTIFLTHNGETLCIEDWARRIGCGHETLRSRIKVLKWSVHKALTTPVNHWK